MKNIVAVVVTYNRKELLGECLNALEDQEMRLNKIIVIDNNSTDGTENFLREAEYFSDENIVYKKLEKNTGGAGGFHEGMKLARELNADWVWIMDDDVVPTKTALKELVEAIKIPNEKISFLASTVYGENGESMNTPTINYLDKEKNGYPGWYKHLNEGIVQIKMATFVSLLINGKALKEVGLPCKDFFIWGDDTEYTNRLTKYFGSAYLVGKSVVIHKRSGNAELNIFTETNKNRIKLWYYMVRNLFINEKEYRDMYHLIKHLITNEGKAILCLFKRNVKYRLKKFLVINKGIFAFLFKRYDYKAFKNRLTS